ncbi:MAG TPA: GNAT family protein [Aggregatilineaceae bacterium]|nr:GNAT family protein [Aggregatilineaceae bacterium]
MLTGLLVDLVPCGERFRKLMAAWNSGPASFWADAGMRVIKSQVQFDAMFREWQEKSDRIEVDFGIQTKDGTLIGEIGMNWMSPYHRFANIGAIIGDPAYWGGGYGTDALMLYIDYAFDWLDLRRIFLDTMSINARVIRQMEKVGFKLEARRREAMYGDGVWYDELIYGLLRDEWLGREALLEKMGFSTTKGR